MLRDHLCHHPQRGTMLIEGLIAILIFAMGILAIVGLQASSMRATTQAKSRIDASFVASQRIGQMWVDQANLANDYTEDATEITELPNGTRTTTVVGNEVTVTVRWRMPGDDTTHSFRTVAQINTNP